MIDRLTYTLGKFRILFAAIAVAVLVVLAYYSETPKIDSRLTGYNIDHNPYDSIGLRMATLFASSNMVQVLIKPEATNVKTLFDGIKEVETEIEMAFPGIRVESVNSASTLLFRKVKGSSPAKEGLTAALGIPIVQNLVSRDTSSLLMVAFADRAENFSSNRFDSIIAKKYPGIESMHAISLNHIQDEIENSIKSDYIVLLPVVLIFIIVFLFLSYRSFSAVLFCFINLSFSLIPGLFFTSLFNVSINQITVTVLPIVAILSFSASVHLVTGFLYRSAQGDKTRRVHETLAHYFLPTFLSTITTAIAFGSFYISDSLYIRQFGIVTACSFVVVFVITYLISPLTLRFVKSSKRKGSPLKFTTTIEGFLLKNRRVISILFFVGTVISVFFISDLTFRINIETYIPRNTQVYANSQEIKRAFHSLTETDLLVEANTAFSDSSNVGNIRQQLVSLVSEITEKIAGYPEVVSVQSIKNQIDFENQQTLPGFRMTLFPRSSNPFVSKDQMKYRINIKLANPDDLPKVNRQLANDFKKYQPQYKYSEYSDSLFFQYISTSVTHSLLRSLIFSALIIVLIIFLLSLSLKATLISVLANVIPLGFLVLIFVAFGIDMNITTSISLVICLGLIVDDTIHILYRRVQLKEPLKELGFGILTTSIIITGGFLSFILSQSRPNQIFGLLCAVVFVIAAISDMTVMTWLLSSKKTEN